MWATTRTGTNADTELSTMYSKKRGVLHAELLRQCCGVPKKFRIHYTSDIIPHLSKYFKCRVKCRQSLEKVILVLFFGTLAPFSDFGLVFRSPARTYFGGRFFRSGLVFRSLVRHEFTRSRWRLWFTQLEPQGSGFQDHFKPCITVLKGRVFRPSSTTSVFTLVSQHDTNMGDNMD